MGLFDGIIKGITGVIENPMSLITGGLGAAGQSATNSANAAINEQQMQFNSEEAARNKEFQHNEAQNQMAFQERMRGTQYQTAVGDMAAAGINPMLAISQGGAGTPSGAAGSGSQASSGSMIQMGNKTAAALNNSATAAQIANTMSATKVNEAQANLIDAQTTNTTATTGKIGAETQNVIQQTQNAKQGLEKLIQETQNEKIRYALISAQEDLASMQADLARERITQTQAETRYTNTMQKIRNLDLPQAKAYADYYGSTMGRSEPYAKGTEAWAGAVGRAIGSATGAGRLLDLGKSAIPTR